MYAMWSNCKINTKYLFITLIFCITLTGCSKTTLEDYNSRRKIPIKDEIQMESMNYYNSDNTEIDIPTNIRDIINNIHEQTNIFYYSKEDINIVFYVEDSRMGAKIWIQGIEYPYSFGEDYSPQESEAPEIALYDINNDGIPDIFIRGEGYRALIRQDVYLSNKDGSYREIGDVTWRNNTSNDFSFMATYEDNYKVHVTSSEYGIDEYVSIGTSFRPVSNELGYYDNNGKLLLKNSVEDLQSQAVRYILNDDNTMFLRYEAQIWAGYSEYCIGHCFVFLYAITDSGYQLKSVTLEQYDY